MIIYYPTYYNEVYTSYEKMNEDIYKKVKKAYVNKSINQ
jgi:hypothetical protein